MKFKAIVITKESWEKLHPREQYEFMVESPVYVIWDDTNVNVICETSTRNADVYNFARMLEKDFPEHLHDILGIASIAWNAIESNTSQAFVFAEANGEISFDADFNSLYWEFYLNNVNASKLRIYALDSPYFEGSC